MEETEQTRVSTIAEGPHDVLFIRNLANYEISHLKKIATTNDLEVYSQSHRNCCF